MSDCDTDSSGGLLSACADFAPDTCHMTSNWT